MKRLFFLAILLASAGQAWGATYTVCSSGCDYTQIDTLLSTEDLGPGDFVDVNGDITENGDVTWTADDDGDGTGVVTLRLNGNEVVISSTTTAGIIFGDGVDGITIENGTLSIDTAGDFILYAAADDDFTDIVISNVAFNNGSADITACIGVEPDSASTISVDRCLFNADGDIGVKVAGTVTTEVTNCVFLDMLIAVSVTGTTATTVYNSTFYNSPTGIFLVSSGPITIKNNIFSTCSTVGVLDWNNNVTETLDYNCWYNNTADVSNATQGANKVEVNPLLVNPGGTAWYHYVPKNKAVYNGGTAIAGITTDYKGFKHVGTTPIGALDFALIRMPYGRD